MADQSHNPDDPREAFTPDLQPRLDEKNAKLADRLDLIDAQAHEELARFGAAPPQAPEPRTPKSADAPGGKAAKSK